MAVLETGKAAVDLPSSSPATAAHTTNWRLQGTTVSTAFYVFWVILDGIMCLRSNMDGLPLGNRAASACHYGVAAYRRISGPWHR